MEHILLDRIMVENIFLDYNILDKERFIGKNLKILKQQQFFLKSTQQFKTKRQHFSQISWQERVWNNLCQAWEQANFLNLSRLANYEKSWKKSINVDKSREMLEKEFPTLQLMSLGHQNWISLNDIYVNRSVFCFLNLF